MEKKAIVIGEYSRVEYHPLKGADKEFEEILTDFQVDCTEDYEQFRADSLASYDICIPFVDHWTEKLSDSQAAGLLTYTCNGGGLLIVHNGIAIQTRYELAQLAGGKFIRHPDQKVLTYQPTPTDHVITEGIKSFSVMEEPYQFELDNFTEKTMLLEYESEGKQWPAAWAHQYGLGKVVYLSPGHSLETFKDPMFRELIRRSALWAASML